MILETIEYRGYRINIVHDEFPDSPRDWDNLWTMYCFHQRYNIGDKHDYNSINFSDWDEFYNAIINDHDVHMILPLYLYGHGENILSRVGPGHTGSQVGFAFVEKSKKKEFLLEGDAAPGELMLSVLEDELNAYNDWANGYVYGYQIIDENREDVDSCYGFYGLDYCIEEAKSIVDHFRNERGALCIS